MFDRVEYSPFSLRARCGDGAFADDYRRISQEKKWVSLAEGSESNTLTSVQEGAMYIANSATR